MPLYSSSASSSVIAINRELITINSGKILVNENGISALLLTQGGGGLSFPLLTDLEAITAAEASQKAEVYGDTDANNGVYRNSGTDIATVWTRIGDLAEVTLGARLTSAEDDIDLIQSPIEWLPKINLLPARGVYDFENNQYWDNKGEVALSDLTSEHGGYSTGNVDWFKGDLTIIIEWTQTSSPSGTLVSFSNGNSVRHEYHFSGQALRSYTLPNGTIQNYSYGSDVPITGRHRLVTTMSAEGVLRSSLDGQAIETQVTAIGNMTAFNKIALGFRSAFSDDTVAGATLHRVVVYDVEVSDADLQQLSTQDGVTQTPIVREYDTLPTPVINGELIDFNGELYKGTGGSYEPVVGEGIPDWLPVPDGEVPDHYYDFVNQHFWKDGEVITLSDFEQTGGFKALTNIATFNSGAIFVDHLFDEDFANPASGAFFCLGPATGSTAFRYLFDVYQPEAGVRRCRLYSRFSDETADHISPDYGLNSKASGKYHHRVGTILKPNQPTKTIVNDGFITSAPKNAADMSFSRMSFGGDIVGGGSVLTGAALNKVMIWTGDRDEAFLRKVNRLSSVPPIHIRGDSFLNNYHVFDAFLKHLTNNHGYVPISQEAFGGSTIEEIRDGRTDTTPNIISLSARSEYHDSTLIILDGGAEAVGTGAENEQNLAYIKAVADMADIMQSGRWLYLQSAPNGDNASVSSRWNNLNTLLKGVCGIHYVPVLEKMQARHNGSADDLTWVLTNKDFPLSMRISATDFHPSALAQEVYGLILYQAWLARGYNAY